MTGKSPGPAFSLYLFYVIRGALPGIGMKNPAEIELVAVSHHLRYVLDKQRPVLVHELLGPLYADSGQILVVGLPGVFSEQFAHVCLGNGKQVGDGLQGERFRDVFA